MKISIITVCLNSEKTIEQTIQSVIGQEYDDYEYIVIDGGSTDGTLRILNEYKKYISMMISEPDEGIYDAMNKGIALATGDIVGILNSDDWYENGVLERIAGCFQNPKMEIVYGRLNVIREDNKKEISKKSDIKKIRYEMAIPHPTVFVRRDVYIKYGIFRQEYKISADYELMLRFYTEGVKFYFLDSVITNFRRGGISGQQGKMAEKEALEIAREYLARAPLNERKFLKDILHHRYMALYFEWMIDDFSYVLPNILFEKLGVGFRDNIVIFGAGKWGCRAYDALLKRGMSSLFLVDNNREKWYRTNSGKTVLPPESLMTYKGVLLILVREFSAEILLQVERLQNSDIYCISWKEIADYCMPVKDFDMRISG